MWRACGEAVQKHMTLAGVMPCGRLCAQSFQSIQTQRFLAAIDDLAAATSPTHRPGRESSRACPVGARSRRTGALRQCPMAPLSHGEARLITANQSTVRQPDSGSGVSHPWRTVSLAQLQAARGSIPTDLLRRIFCSCERVAGKKEHYGENTCRHVDQYLSHRVSGASLLRHSSCIRVLVIAARPTNASGTRACCPSWKALFGPATSASCGGIRRRPKHAVGETITSAVQLG